jgi:predicted metal-binding membrane protein
MGLEHGAFCVGCCWVLMLLLFVGGIMNPVWIAILSLLVVVENIVRFGPQLAYLVGAILIVWGVATLLV